METAIKLNQRKIVTIAVKYVLLTLLMACCSLAEFFGMRPLGTGLFFAYIMLSVPTAFAAAVFGLAEMTASFTLATFLSTVITIGLGVCLRIVLGKVKFYQKTVSVLFTAASGAGLVFLIKMSNYTLLMLFLTILISIAFLYVAYAGLKPIITEKLKYKFLETELVAVGVLTVSAAVGLCCPYFSSVPIVAAVAAFSIFLAGNLSGFGAAAATAFCFGLGAGVKNYDATNIAAFLFIAAAAGVFKGAPRALTMLAGLVAYVMFVFYFNTDYSKSIAFIVSLVAGGVLFCLVPKRFLQSVKDYIFEPHERTAVRYMLNKSRADTGASLYMSAEIFEAMANALRTPVNAAQNFSGALKAKVCAFCPRFNECEQTRCFTHLDIMLSSVLKSGRVAVGEIPDEVSSNCNQLAKLISAASDIVANYESQKLKTEYENGAREIVASHLCGMGEVLKSIALKNGEPLQYDRDKEKLLLEELNYSGISCVQSLIAGDSTALIIRTECFEREQIEKTVSKILRSNYNVTGIDDTMLAGFSAVHLKRCPPLDMVFGVAACPKEKGGDSGDTHSFIKLDNSRFMIALCDAMGSGTTARDSSETAIGLIENFYKAGFDSELVLSSVNRFLSLNSGESFSALDVCVVDLEKSTADIIKLGSPATYIRKKDTIEKVDGKALPLGVSDQIRPGISRVELNIGDTLVMASDGVSDSFDGDKLSATVLNLRTLNPQTLAESVLDQTLSNNKGIPKDDSTVIAARLIRKL